MYKYTAVRQNNKIKTANIIWNDILRNLEHYFMTSTMQSHFSNAMIYHHFQIEYNEVIQYCAHLTCEVILPVL